MSYAVIKNKKYQMNTLNLIYRHNERRNANYSNKEIDLSKTDQNYYFKKPNDSYIKEFNRIKKENYLLGGESKRQIVACEFVVSSDYTFFNRISDDEARRYFQESYNFIKNFNGLNEKYIISAVVHMDEYTPHMHVVYIPVVHILDEETGEIKDKILSSEFWKGRFSYRNLQDKFYKHIASKGFDLERGIKTSNKGFSMDAYKQYTNFEKLKKKIEEEEKLMTGDMVDVVNENKRLVIDINSLKLQLKDFETVSHQRNFLSDKCNYLEAFKEKALMDNYSLKVYVDKAYEVLEVLFETPRDNIKRVVENYVRTTSTIDMPDLVYEQVPNDGKVINIESFLEKNFGEDKLKAIKNSVRTKRRIYKEVRKVDEETEESINKVASGFER